MVEIKLSIEARTIFRYWNHRKETMTHRVFSAKRKRKIATVLKEYTVDEVLHAIFNHATILGSPYHFWTYKWTIEDFLQRGLEKFLDEADPYENFKSKGTVAVDGKPKVQSNTYKDRFEQYKKANTPEARKKLEEEWRNNE